MLKGVHSIKRKLLLTLVLLAALVVSSVGCIPKKTTTPTATPVNVLQTLQDKVNAIESRLGQQETKTASISANEISNLKDQINSAKSDISQLKNSEYGTKLTSLNTQLTAIDAKLSKYSVDNGVTVTDLTSRLAQAEAKLANSSLDISYGSVAGGISATVKSSSARTMAFRVTLIPTSVYPLTGATYADAMLAAYPTSPLVNRTYDAKLHFNPLPAPGRWELSSFSFTTGSVSVQAGQSNTWPIYFAATVSCNVYVEALESASTGTSTSGGI